VVLLSPYPVGVGNDEARRGPTRYDLDRESLGSVVAGVAPGQPRYRVDQVWDGMHRRLLAPEELTELPRPLRAALGRHPALASALEPAGEWDADGGQTRKWVWRLADGARIETVLMHARNAGGTGSSRSTVCVSTQAGCAMGCGFCATGQAGFERHLRVGEIVEQVTRAGRAATEQGHRLTHVVFMGMGEPLANYDATWAAVRRLHDDLGLSARHLTISTVGIVPGIRRLAREDLPVNLAVSLHAADDALRDQLVPINRRYPLSDLAAACRDYFETKGRRVSLEWALIAGVNDRRSDAEQLAAFARPLAAHVNLIPLNPTPGYAVVGSSPRAVRAFRDDLRAAGVNVTVRRPRGRDIAAACGQLAAGRAPSTTPDSPVTLTPRRSPG
jgi:23S rRNA (adenine2503-C2)-methyltransferase